MKDDLISRQMAINMCREPRMRNADCSDFEMEIMMLPSAQPKIKCIANITLADEQIKEVFEKAKCNILAIQPNPRKKGKWIVDNVETEHCSVCKHRFYISALFAVGGNDEPPSCPWCGADMREEEINKW